MSERMDEKIWARLVDVPLQGLTKSIFDRACQEGCRSRAAEALLLAEKQMAQETELTRDDALLHTIDEGLHHLQVTIERAAKTIAAAVLRAEYERERYKASPTDAGQWAAVTSDVMRDQAMRDSRELWNATAKESGDAQ